MQTEVNQFREVKHVSAEKMIRTLRRRIRIYERRYEMPSAKMLDTLTKGEVRETAEIVKWMFDYHALRYFQDMIRTTGTPGITIKQSTVD